MRACMLLQSLFFKCAFVCLNCTVMHVFLKKILLQENVVCLPAIDAACVDLEISHLPLTSDFPLL